MFFYTFYSDRVSSLLTEIVNLGKAATCLHYDSARLFNDANHDDVPMPALTFKTERSFSDIRDGLVNPDKVFLCIENSEDWE